MDGHAAEDKLVQGRVMIPCPVFMYGPFPDPEP